MNYTQKELKEALEDFNRFIKMTKSSPKGIPKRLLIVRDLLQKTIKGE